MDCGPEQEPHVLLIIGAPGIGKTTANRRVAAELEARGLLGFSTQEIRERGERRGFRLVSFDGKEHIISHVTFSRARSVYLEAV